MPLLFLWHGSLSDGRSSGLSVWHRVGGSTRRASYTPSPSDTHFSCGSIINTPESARRHFDMFVSRWNQTQVHAEGGPPSARCPRDARSVHGDRSFDWNEVDFLLFGVTTEEIRWLQSGVVVPSVTHPPAPSSVGETRTSLARPLSRQPRLSCLRARRPVDLCGHPPSLGSCVRRVEDAPRGSRRHLRCPRSTRRGPLVFTVFAASSLKIERRFMRRVDRRVQSRGSGCPLHKKQLLQVLVVLAPPRKKRNQEQHALNGNTSASAASSSYGMIPGTWSKRHSDGTLVVLPLRGAAALDPSLA